MTPRTVSLRRLSVWPLCGLLFLGAAAVTAQDWAGRPAAGGVTVLAFAVTWAYFALVTREVRGWFRAFDRHTGARVTTLTLAIDEDTLRLVVSGWGWAVSPGLDGRMSRGNSGRSGRDHLGSAPAGDSSETVLEPTPGVIRAEDMQHHRISVILPPDWGNPSRASEDRAGQDEPGDTDPEQGGAS